MLGKSCVKVSSWNFAKKRLNHSFIIRHLWDIFFFRKNIDLFSFCFNESDTKTQEKVKLWKCVWVGKNFRILKKASTWIPWGHEFFQEFFQEFRGQGHNFVWNGFPKFSSWDKNCKNQSLILSCNNASSKSF